MIFRKIATLIICSLIAAVPLTAKEQRPDAPTKKALLNFPVVNVKNLTEEMVMAFLSGDANNVILEFSEGTLIPFKTSLEGNIINILPKDRDPIYFSIQQSFYIAFTEEDTYFSKDLADWSPASSFFNGSVDFTIDTGPEGPSLRLSGEISH